MSGERDVDGRTRSNRTNRAEGVGERLGEGPVAQGRIEDEVEVEERRRVVARPEREVVAGSGNSGLELFEAGCGKQSGVVVERHDVGV